MHNERVYYIINVEIHYICVNLREKGCNAWPHMAHPSHHRPRWGSGVVHVQVT